MQQVPAYTIKWEDGSTSHIKSGKVLVRKAVKSSETRSDLRSQCRMLVIQYAADLQASNK
jgi:hypothetical protein